MMFRVLGYSKENAAKVTLEIEAQSKAEAERKALRQNIEITRIELASEASAREASAPRPVPGRSSSRGSSGGLTKLLFLLVLVALAVGAYLYWPQLMALVGKKG